MLRQGLTQPVIAWDTVAMPDGRYTLRIVARRRRVESRGVRARRARGRARASKSTTPRPASRSSRADAGQSGHRVIFTAEDDISSIQSVEYAVNSGKWTIVFPTDGIADSKQESFDFTLPGYRDGGSLYARGESDRRAREHGDGTRRPG